VYVWVIKSAPCSKEELADFDMKAQGFRFISRPDLDRSYKGYISPLRWIQYHGRGKPELFLTEEKLDPFPSSPKLREKNDKENLLSIYGLIKLSDAISMGDNISDTGSVLDPQSVDPRDDNPVTTLNILIYHGYIPQGLDESLIIIWDPPIQISLRGTSDNPKMTTLLEIIDQDRINISRQTITINLIDSIYKLLEAR
jgi:hypothetical protein